VVAVSFFYAAIQLSNIEKRKERPRLDPPLDPRRPLLKKRIYCFLFSSFRERERRSRCVKYLVQNDPACFGFAADLRIRGSGTDWHSSPYRAAYLCRPASL